MRPQTIPNHHNVGSGSGWKRPEKGLPDAHVTVGAESASLAFLALWPCGFLYFEKTGRTPERPQESALHGVLQRFPYVAQWREAIRESLRRPRPEDARLATLGEDLSLSPLETLAAALCLACEEDPHTADIVSFLQPHIGSARPSVGLMAQTLGAFLHHAEGDSPTALLAAGPAARNGLLHRTDDSLPLCDQQLTIPLPLALSLRGVGKPWPGTFLAPTSLPPNMPETFRREARAHARALEHSSAGLLIRSSSGGDARLAAELIAQALGRRAVYVPGGFLPLLGFGLYCRLERLLPVFVLESGPGLVHRLPSIEGYSGPVLAVCGPDGVAEADCGPLAQWWAPLPGKEERRRLWLESGIDPEVAESLAATHLHGVDRIRRLSALALMEAQVRGRSQIDKEDIRRAAFHGDGLETLAQPIPDRVPESALVLSEPTRRKLDLLEARCRHREDLGPILGITMQASYKAGVRALFVGPSGTGKTLAASRLATRLGFPLYRVDLAAVTSKYVGDTEKQLSRLLAAAEQADVILLFDEADSLFGKRTDVKDANDRFANAQTNYLLQRIEDYRGIILLTSNSRTRFDSSFSRRIDVVVDFPAPGPEERRALWKTHLGEKHALHPAQMNLLAAHADVCGGHIRNAVLTAAVLALEAARPVSWEDVMEGLKLEYTKLSRQIPAVLLEAE